MTGIRLSGLVALLTAALAFSPPTHAATNAVRGGIGGIDNGTLVGGAAGVLLHGLSLAFAS